MEKIHIERNTVQETLVIPLKARKICTESFGDFFTDRKAIELMDRLDYDFGSKKPGYAQRFAALEVAARQKDCAWEVREYLKAHPRATVVNLGCGLDQTAEACDNGTCQICNVDLPDIIAIRNRLIPPADRVTNVAGDLNNPDWFRSIPMENGAIFFATGVFYYFSREQMQKLINDMAEYFPGGVLVFDVCGKVATKVGVKGWVKQAGIDVEFNPFYVVNLDRDINPWLKHAKASTRGYMLGYFDLREKSIGGFSRFLAKVADRIMKTQILKFEFDPA